jgi:hypothetical protein
MFEALRKKSEPSSPESETGEQLEWTCHPVKRKPWTSVAVYALILLFAVLVWIGTESRMFTSLSIVILFLSLSKFYLPTGYKLTEKKIYVKSLTQTLVKEWTMYRTFYPDKNGVLLSTFAGPSRLENFRGLYLLFENNRDQVVEFVRKRIVAQAEQANPSKGNVS